VASASNFNSRAVSAVEYDLCPTKNLSNVGRNSFPFECATRCAAPGGFGPDASWILWVRAAEDRVVMAGSLEPKWGRTVLQL
jgi:hypothetical protein